ncbi:MAG: methylenetetrahydrofolate reductase [NAD(P)H] [Subdoligranulum sp.]|nr:methylenetetrahydrofolate reductase [NAD(P)H] [Subdoligranulum sp.]
MYISEMFQKKSCLFSLEVFPPKKEGAVQSVLYPALETMSALKPDFISVTYGAGGGMAGQSTAQIASHIKNELGIESIAHLTCVHSTREQVQETLAALRAANVENVLALRGDVNPDLPRCMDFPHASDLAAAVTAFGGFDVTGACYPEGHAECPSLRQDVENLRYKVEAGATHLITQLFFDNICYYRFLNMARKAGITVPVHAGVMPIVNSRQIERTVKLSSASLPPQFTKMISRYADDAQGLYDAGIDYAIGQIRDLITGGADGIHLYAMNNADVVQRVYEGVRDLLPERAEKR